MQARCAAGSAAGPGRTRSGSSVTLARAALPLCAVLAATGVLAACEKPTPGVTVQSRGNSIYAEALCWDHSGGVPLASDCAGLPGEIRDLPVRANESVAVNVDEELEEKGWVPSLNGRPLVAEPLKGTAFRFDVPADVLREDPELRVRAVHRLGGRPQGEWAFRLLEKQ